jgi:hypothetical protein
MANGRTSWLTRTVGLALARRALRRALAGNGLAAGATLERVISGAGRTPDLRRSG